MPPHYDPRSQIGMFWRAHDRVFGTITAFAETQLGPNPITEAEWQQLQAKRPDRYGHIPYLRPRVPSPNT